MAAIRRERRFARSAPLAAFLALAAAAEPGRGQPQQPQDQIVGWTRDETRIRQDPAGPSRKVPSKDLPKPVTILERTPEGLLRFSFEGQRAYVSQGDAVTTIAPREVCPQRPGDRRPSLGTGNAFGARC